MSAQSSQRSIFGSIRVAGTPAISAHKASNAIGFLRTFEKRRASGACSVRPRIDRSEPKGASSRDNETEGIWNTTRPRKRGRSRQGPARRSLEVGGFASIVTRLTQIHVIDERNCGTAARIDMHDVCD